MPEIGFWITLEVIWLICFGCFYFWTKSDLYLRKKSHGKEDGRLIINIDTGEARLDTELPLKELINKKKVSLGVYISYDKSEDD